MNKFESFGLVDVVPLNFKPTWSNNRTRDEGIGKRLDHFLVHHSLLESLCSYWSWVEPANCYDNYRSSWDITGVIGSLNHY